MATCYQYHGSWYIQWTQNGKRQKECIGRVSVVSHVEARLKAKAKEVELATGKVIFSSVPTLSQFVPEYLSWHEKEYPSSHFRVRQIVEQYLLPDFGVLPMDHIKSMPIERYKHKRKDQGAKSATITKELRTLKAMLNCAVDWEILPVMPLRRIKEPQNLDSKPPEFYTIEQMGKLYQAATGLHASIWRLFANTGMRRKEGLILRRTWIGKEGMKILSSEEDRTKSGLWRDIPLTDGAIQALEEIPKDGIYVLPRVRPPSLSRACLSDAGKAGLNGGLHTLRHTYISHLVMAGVPLRTVQKLAGHAHYSTTERYAHLAPGHLQDAGRKISL